MRTELRLGVSCFVVVAVLAGCGAEVSSLDAAPASTGTPGSDVPEDSAGGTQGSTGAPAGPLVPAEPPAPEPGTPATDGGAESGPQLPGPQADAGTPSAPQPPCVPAANPTLLSQTCLYRDVATQQLDPDSLAYEPAHALWTDGAAKRRWIRLPPGQKIDTSNMDRWVFPVGTRLFKEFALAGKRLETRMVERTGASTYKLVAFVWRADGSDAELNTQGLSDVLGTSHDVPSQDACLRCHQGEPGRVLGFSAVQLSKPGPGLNLTGLASRGWLSHPPPAGALFPAPGTPTESAALGYLHANCGHCHNPEGAAWQRVGLHLRLYTADTTPAATPTVRTTVGVRTTAWTRQHTFRVVARNAADSDLYDRLTTRGGFNYAMPQLGSEQVDPEGAAKVKAWIDSL